MAYVNNGTARSLVFTVTKTIGGALQQGYPKTYNGKLAGSTWGHPEYAALTDQEARQLSDVDYAARLADLQDYIEGVESGSDFSTDVVGDGPTKLDPLCLPTTSTTTTTAAPTTTTTTAAPVPTTTTTTTEDADLTPINGNGPEPSFETITCFTPSQYVFYTNSQGLIIAVGDRIYTTNDISSPLTGGWYLLVDLNAIVRRFRIGLENGEVIAISAC